MVVGLGTQPNNFIGSEMIFMYFFLIVYQYLLVITESLHRISVYRQDTFLINWPIFTEKVTMF